MSENYPVVLDGETVGTLSVTRDGLLWIYDIHCAAPKGLVRVSAYGEKEGYLGVLMPDGKGSAGLRKCFTRAANEAMPQNIRYVSKAGEPIAHTDEESDEEADTETAHPDEVGADPAPETDPVCSEAAPALLQEDMPEKETEQSGIQWRRCAGGALMGTQNGARFLAVPLKGSVAPMDGQFIRQKIENVDYAVFEMKKGK